MTNKVELRTYEKEVTTGLIDVTNPKVEGIILAAGLATRIGGFKMSLDLHGKTLFERCLEPMLQVCSRVIVVGGHKIEILETAAAKYPQLELVFNARYQDGMFSSVREGVRHIHQPNFFLIPGDYPLVRGTTYRDMLKVKGDIIVAGYQGRTGHPVLFSSRLIPDLLAAPEHERLNDFTKAKGFIVFETDDPGVRIDVDTWEDYTRVLASMS